MAARDILGYGILLAGAALSRLALEAFDFDFVSAAQEMFWSWRYFAVFVACYALAAVAAHGAQLPSPPDTLARWRTRLLQPVAIGILVALLTVVSDVIDPVAKARGVATIHVAGGAAAAFYAYGAVLLTTVFHFLPIAPFAWLATRAPAGARAMVVSLGIAIAAFSEDAGYFARAPVFDMEWARHALSVAANGTEALFIYRYGLLAGIAQRASTYLVWHIFWPSWDVG
jgi:hypothetical protein